MDLYTVFAPLPPPPPPSLFSLPDPHHTRARFPDFLLEDDPAAACRAFMHALMRPSMPQFFRPQYIALCTTVTAISVASIAVIAFRIRRRAFWICKLTRRASGSLLSWNSTNIFCACCACLGFLLLGVVIQQLLTYGWDLRFNWGNGLFVTRESLSRSYGRREACAEILRNLAVIWIPLLFACHWSAWGLVHASASSNSGRSSLQGRWSSKRVFSELMERPILYNTLVITVSCVVRRFAICNHADLACPSRPSSQPSSYASSAACTRTMETEPADVTRTTGRWSTPTHLSATTCSRKLSRSGIVSELPHPHRTTIDADCRLQNTSGGTGGSRSPSSSGSLSSSSRWCFSI